MHASPHANGVRRSLNDSILMTCSAAVFHTASQVQILLKDVIGGGHKPQTFHSPLRIKRRGRLVDVGTLEAKVCLPPLLPTPSTSSMAAAPDLFTWCIRPRSRLLRCLLHQATADA